MKDKRINVFVHVMFRELNARAIKYSVLRNWEKLPDDLNGSDLDICVSVDDAQRFRDTLSFVCHITNSFLVSELHDFHSYKVCFLNSDAGAQIDVFLGGIYYKRKMFFSEGQIFSHSICYNDVNVLRVDFAYLLAYVKEIIHNSQCETKYIQPLYQNKKVYTFQFVNDAFSLLGKEFSSKVHTSLQAETLSRDTLALAKSARSGLHAGLVDYSSIIKLQRLVHNPGYAIVLLGTDGSGKSTIIDELIPWLEGPFHNGIIYNHLRPNLFPDIAVLMGQREKKEVFKEEIVCTTPHAMPPSGYFGSIMRWGYYMLDYSIGYLTNIYPHICRKSKLAVFDRYYYDYYVDPLRARIKLPRWIFRLGEFFIPKPDIILCLGGDPEKIYARKPETSLEEVTRQTEELKRFAAKRKNAVWIDTTQPIENSIRDAKSAILDVLSQRFKDVL